MPRAPKTTRLSHGAFSQAGARARGGHHRNFRALTWCVGLSPFTPVLVPKPSPAATVRSPGMILTSPFSLREDRVRPRHFSGNVSVCSLGSSFPGFVVIAAASPAAGPTAHPPGPTSREPLASPFVQGLPGFGAGERAGALPAAALALPPSYWLPDGLPVSSWPGLISSRGRGSRRRPCCRGASCLPPTAHLCPDGAREPQGPATSALQPPDTVQTQRTFLRFPPAGWQGRTRGSPPVS